MNTSILKIFTSSVITFIMGMMILSCEASHKELRDFSLPDELKDCKIYLVDNGLNTLYIVRCPNSNTSVSTTGKHKTHTFTIEMND